MKTIKMKEGDAYTKTDGYDPIIEGGLLKLLAPYDFTLSPNEKVKVGLGISFACPVIVGPSATCERQGVKVTSSCPFASGEEVVLVLENVGENVAFFEPRSVLARATMLPSVLKL